MTDGNNTSNKEFTIAEGLQQGAVNSPILFNIFLSDLLRSYYYNEEPKKNIIAYADDIIIYTSDVRVDVIQERLQAMFNSVLEYFHMWRLRANPAKCETILMRTPLSRASRNVKRHWRSFRIFPGADAAEPVEHKTRVRYLGVHIDQYLYLTDHLNIQLSKARNAFMLLKRLFFSKHMSADVKVICYKTLIRPLLTYGAPIWYNMSPTNMERLRVFERRVLRTCCGRYRTIESGFTHYVSNKDLYTACNTDRLDIFIIQIIREHFQRAADTADNNLISHLFFPNDLYYMNCMDTGHIPPEAFLFLDRENYIQRRDGVPAIYHNVRRPTDKKIARSANSTFSFRYSTDIPDVVTKRGTTPYWWRT